MVTDDHMKRIVTLSKITDFHFWTLLKAQVVFRNVTHYIFKAIGHFLSL